MTPCCSTSSTLLDVVDGDADFEVVGEAGDGAEAVRAVQRVEPGVILMDLHARAGRGRRDRPAMRAVRARQAVLAPSVASTFSTAYKHGLLDRPGRARAQCVPPAMFSPITPAMISATEVIFSTETASSRNSIP